MSSAIGLVPHDEVPGARQYEIAALIANLDRLTDAP